MPNPDLPPVRVLPPAQSHPPSSHESHPHRPGTPTPTRSAPTRSSAPGAHPSRQREPSQQLQPASDTEQDAEAAPTRPTRPPGHPEVAPTAPARARSASRSTVAYAGTEPVANPKRQRYSRCTKARRCAPRAEHRSTLRGLRLAPGRTVLPRRSASAGHRKTGRAWMPVGPGERQGSGTAEHAEIRRASGALARTFMRDVHVPWHC